MQAVGLLIFARTLGPAEYAIIVAATAVAAVATEFVGFGSGDLLIREVSRDPSSHRSAFGRALRLVAITIVPVALLATLVVHLWFQTSASFAVLLVIVASEIIAARVLFMTEQIAIAHHQTHAANGSRIFASAVRLTTICLALFVAGVSTAAQWAPFSAIFATISATGCLILSVRTFGWPDFRAPFGSELHIGVMFSLMQIIRAAQFSIDKFAVGWIAPGSTVGAFGVASRISQLGNLPATAITRITYPMFFAEGAEGLPSAISFAKKVGPLVAAVGILSSLALVVVAFVLPFFFGSAYAPAETFLLLMALLPLAAGFQNLMGDTLSGADFQVQRVVAGGIGLGLTIAAAAIGATIGGISGSVMGYMAGQFITALILWITVISVRWKHARLPSPRP
jgi:O-antigen/teichoic acid export membrane protein